MEASQEATGRPHVKPISYAEIDNQTPAIPGFSDSIVVGDRNAKQSSNFRGSEKSTQQVTRGTQKLSIGADAGMQAKDGARDVEMYVTTA